MLKQHVFDFNPENRCDIWTQRHHKWGVIPDPTRIWFNHHVTLKFLMTVGGCGSSNWKQIEKCWSNKFLISIQKTDAIFGLSAIKNGGLHQIPWGSNSEPCHTEVSCDRWRMWQISRTEDKLKTSYLSTVMISTWHKYDIRTHNHHKTCMHLSTHVDMTPHT